MCDHVKPKSLLCSYKIDFKSEVIINMQKEITNKTWLGNSVLWNRMYGNGRNKRDY